jgi:hypothetical protein
VKIVTLLFIAMLVGCGKSSTNADYVDAHHCTTDGKIHTLSPSVVVMDGKEIVVSRENDKPYTFYSCPNGLYVTIYTDEPQPKVKK